MYKLVAGIDRHISKQNICSVPLCILFPVWLNTLMRLPLHRIFVGLSPSGTDSCLPICTYSEPFEPTLLCESVLLVKGKSFVTLYTDFSFIQLKENTLVKEFSLLLKAKCFRD